MRWAGHAERTGRGKNAYRILWGNLKERVNSEDLVVDGLRLNLYCSPNIIWVSKCRRMRWAWHVERMGRGKKCILDLVWKLEGKSQLGRPSRRWVKIKPVLLNKLSSGEQIHKAEMDRARRTYGERKKLYIICWGNSKERVNLEDLSADVMIILKWIYNKWNGVSVDWTNPV